MNYWLFKSEPSSFSIADLNNAAHQTTSWDGVRNYQARNMLRDNIKKEDLAFFYHSSCPEPGIVGTIKIIKEGYPDSTQFNAKSPYFDPKSVPEHPKWYNVDVQLVHRFSRVISLSSLRAQITLKNMIILRPGNRLSITPITPQEWEAILALSQENSR